jgi:hypothetical protein
MEAIVAANTKPGEVTTPPVPAMDRINPGATVQCPDGCWSFSENPDEDWTCHGHTRTG